MSNSPQSSSMTPALGPGDKIGYFQVLEPLGSGGMSLLWKGKDSLLGRFVAIKQLANAATLDEGMREKFKTEADIQKKLSTNSENLVKVIDMIDEPRGLFIVMEYIEGNSLEALMSQSESAMDPKQGLNLIYRLALGLKEMHDANVIHRDLKPSNVLLTKKGEVKICDFGLATIMSSQEQLTFGTTRYMAPELFGEGAVDTRVDIYALGMVAYEVLAGRGQFEKTFRTVLRDQRNQAMRWMKWQTNARLTAPALTTLNENISEPISDLVSRMMDKDITKRIESAEQLIAVLKNNFSASAKVAARVEAKKTKDTQVAALKGSDVPTAPLPKKSRLPLILAINAAIMLALIGGGVWYIKVYKPQQAKAELRGQALARFEQGKQLIQETKYTEAMTIFTELAGDWPGDANLDKPSHLYAAGCQANLFHQQAQQLVADGKFADSRDAYRKAMEQFEKAEGLAAEIDYPRDKLRSKIEQMKNHVFATEALASVFKLIENADYPNARRQIRTLTDEHMTAFGPGEKKQLDSLGVVLEHRRNASKVQTQIGEIQRLVVDGKMKEALELVSTLRQKYPSNATIAQLLKQVDTDVRYAASMNTGRTAENNGLLPEAITAYQMAYAIRPSTELESSIKNLMGSSYYQRGMTARDAGQLDQATNWFVKADALGNPAAKTQLQAMGTAKQRYLVEQQGDTAFAAGKPNEAKVFYEKAQEIEEVPMTQQKIMRCELRIYVRDAGNLIQNGDFKTAGELIDKAMVIDSSDQLVNQLQDELNDRVTYAKYVMDAERFRAKGDFGPSIMSLRKARKLAEDSVYIEATEIELKLKDTAYDNWMAKARNHIANRQWVIAKSCLKPAQAIKDTKEVRNLLVKVELALEK